MFARNRTNIRSESTKAGLSIEPFALRCSTNHLQRPMSDRPDVGSHNGTRPPRLHLPKFRSRCLTEKLLLLFVAEDAGLVIRYMRKYVRSMSLNAVRRLLVILLTLSLTLGPAVIRVHASSMSMEVAATSLGDAHHDGNCRDCPGSKNGLSPGECSACCTGVPGVSVPTAVIDVLPAETQRYLTPNSLADHRIPPDPYPPRHTVLS